MQMNTSDILSMPNNLMAPEGVAAFFAIACVTTGFAALLYTLFRLIKNRDTIPLMIWLGGLLAFTVEAFGDCVGHIWWPHNLPGPVLWFFGVRLPLFIMIEYTAFAVVSYGAYRMFKNGITKKQLWGVWIILMSADILFEMPFTSHAAFVYYGFTPFQIFGFPAWWGWINGTAFILIGFIL